MMLTSAKEVSMLSLTARHKLRTSSSPSFLCLKGKRSGMDIGGEKLLSKANLCVFPHIHAACPATEPQEWI